MFDYNKTVAQVEELLKKIEDPDTGVVESQRLAEEAGAQLDSCYAYLRGERQKEEACPTAAQ